MTTIAHVSDMHVTAGRADRLRALADCLREVAPDLVICTGDVTDLGDSESFSVVADTFPAISGSRVIWIPGNHDACMPSWTSRISSLDLPGVRVVAVDARRRRRWGGRTSAELERSELDQIAELVQTAPPGVAPIVACHWPITPIEWGPSVPSTWPDWLGWPLRNEVRSGRILLGSIFPRCRLYLHGHRHERRDLRFWVGDRECVISNCGPTLDVGGFRLWGFDGGEIVSSRWMAI